MAKRKSNRRLKNPVGNTSYFSQLGLHPEEIFYYLRPQNLEERVAEDDLPLYKINLKPNQTVDLNIKSAPFFWSYGEQTEFPAEYVPYSYIWFTEETPGLPPHFHSTTLIPGLSIFPKGAMVPEGYTPSELLIPRRPKRPSGAMYVEAPDRGLGLVELHSTPLGNSPQMMDSLSRLPPPPEHESLQRLALSSMIGDIAPDPTMTPEQRVLADYARHLYRTLIRGFMDSHEKNRLLSLMNRRKRALHSAILEQQRELSSGMFREHNPSHPPVMPPPKTTRKLESIATKTKIPYARLLDEYRRGMVEWSSHPIPMGRTPHSWAMSAVHAYVKNARTPRD